MGARLDVEVNREIKKYQLVLISIISTMYKEEGRDNGS